MLRHLACWLALPALFALVTEAYAQDPELDPVTGLKRTGDWELVRNHCTACHSARLITQQRGSAPYWIELIRWMQETQNLWTFEPDTEERIVTYLATNYPPRVDHRRAPLRRKLMPPNPYPQVD